MFLRLFLLFALVPVVELALLIEAGQYLGVLPTVSLVVGTGAAGAALARSQGLQVLERLKQALANAAFPGEEIFDIIRYFGERDKIFNVHFRNINGGFWSFVETFPDEGDIDFLDAIKVY